MQIVVGPVKQAAQSRCSLWQASQNTCWRWGSEQRASSHSSMWFYFSLSLRAQSTRGVASSQALFRGVPLKDICVAAGWSSPLSGFTTLTLIRLQVLRSCLFEPTVCCWFIFGPDRQLFSLACLVYRSQSVQATQCWVTYERERLGLLA